MLVFWDAAELGHSPHFFLQRGMLRRHLETPDRAAALLAACRAMGLAVAAPQPADPVALARVHTPAYLAFLREAWGAWSALDDRGAEMVPNVHPGAEILAGCAVPPAGIIGRLGWYTADTACPITAGTWPAALAAAATALAAADEVARGRVAFALARPPGHHAFPARAGGHCYLNNAALAAERLRDRGAGRVAVLDIDAHHGNGTQDVFWMRGDVFFASVHGDPDHYYPWFIGRRGERGAGPGEGATLNLPLPLGADDAAWLAALAQALAAIRAFGPDALVLSLGFDPSRSEPLAFLAVSDEGFARAGAAIGRLRLPTAIVQEGGYNIESMGRLLSLFLDAFLAAAAAS